MRSSAFRLASPQTLLGAIALLGASRPYAQVVFTVGAGGTHSSIQAAVNACPTTGCVIQLTEADYHLPREIWIENKDNLAIEAAPALRLAGTKPRIHTSASLFDLAGTAIDSTDPSRPAGWRRWPIKGSSNKDPGGAGNTTNPYSVAGFQYNGLIMIDSSRNVRIEGLVIDGEVPKTFVNTSIWNEMYDVFFGNVGVNLMRSRNVTVRDCEIRKFFAAIYINGRNPGGLAAPLNNIEEAPRILPGSTPGAVGDHLIEGNTIRNNWYALFDEMEWDLGSTIRFNRSLDNRNASLQRGSDATAEANNMLGGFLYVKDVPLAIHRIHNNTIWGSPLVIGHGYFKPGVQHLFYNNIVGGFDRLSGTLRSIVNNDRQLLRYYSAWLDNNLFEVGAHDSLYQTQNMNGDLLEDSIVCASNGQMSPCFLRWDAPVVLLTDIKNQWLWNGWKVKKGGTYVANYNSTPHTIASTLAVEQFPGGGMIESSYGSGTTQQDISSAKNRWVRTLTWESMDTGKASLLTPVWADDQVLRVAKGQGRPASGGESGILDLGAMPFAGVRPAIHGLRSQLPPLPKAGNCWGIPLVPDFQTVSGSITSVTAWRVLGMTDASPTPIAPKLLTVLPFSDSGIANTTVNICLAPTVFETDSYIRFQIESSVKLKNGLTVAQEPAYFLAPTAVPTRLSPHSARNAKIRLSRVSHALVANGLSEGIARMTLRSLDGRVLREASFPTRAGTLSLDLQGISRRAVVVQVQQGDNSWQSVTSIF